MSDRERHRARDEARRFLELELSRGRGRIVLPRRITAPPHESAETPDVVSRAATAAPTRSKEVVVPPSPKSSIAPASPSGARSAKPENQPLPPFTALRSDEMVERVAAALVDPATRASTCTACDLAATRKTVVFGTGSARSGIVFIGEAPGANEDEQGVPFVGRAGQLLDRILAAIGVARDDVYICNVLKCRPPGNRDPRPEEAAACAEFLRAQLDALRPRVLCALGLHAARWLLPTKDPMGKLRESVHEYRGIPTVATYHPAALLRNPGLKPKAWDDFKRLRALAERAAGADDESRPA